ncbi:hypothetical protein [Rhodopila sp.]|uniref:hypothetical protein n=1 Tax=Rhodopila sp. TaxID=2480087 RepID=UPI003D10735D
MARPIREEPIVRTTATCLYQSQATAFDAALAVYKESPSRLIRRLMTTALIAEGFLPVNTPFEPPPRAKREAD